MTPIPLTNSGKEEIEVGDRILYKPIFGSLFTADIIAIKRGVFGKKYYGKWVVNDVDFGIKYQTTGRLYSFNIVGKY